MVNLDALYAIHNLHLNKEKQRQVVAVSMLIVSSCLTFFRASTSPAVVFHCAEFSTSRTSIGLILDFYLDAPTAPFGDNGPGFTSTILTRTPMVLPR
jgi:hypothetical protein